MRHDSHIAACIAILAPLEGCPSHPRPRLASPRLASLRCPPSPRLSPLPALASPRLSQPHAILTTALTTAHSPTLATTSQPYALTTAYNPALAPPLSRTSPITAGDEPGRTELMAGTAADMGLPRITVENYKQFPLRDNLSKYKRQRSNSGMYDLPDDSPPARWFWQVTGRDWQPRTAAEFDKAKDKYRDLSPSRKKRTRKRPATADDSRRRQQLREAVRAHEPARLPLQLLSPARQSGGPSFAELSMPGSNGKRVKNHSGMCHSTMPILVSSVINVGSCSRMSLIHGCNTSLLDGERERVAKATPTDYS